MTVAAGQLATKPAAPRRKPIVVALGGNALARRGEPAAADVQRRNVAIAVESIADLAADHDIVVTHGNGPQVGLLALQSERSTDVAPYPLDVLGAETEGMIGYLLEQGLDNALPGREIATLLTQVIVDADDPAFAAPSKPIGPVYSEQDARRLAAERGWVVAADGDAFRRVVASPQPQAIVELRTIRSLVAAGVLVICAGGGGIPVVADAAGALRAAEAVIDKDLAAALLATCLGAEALLMLTDVQAIERDWDTPHARPLRNATPDDLRRLSFAPGSMGPKVQAACRFVEATGGFAAIGAIGNARAMLNGRRGTTVVADRDRPRFDDRAPRDRLCLVPPAGDAPRARAGRAHRRLPGGTRGY